MELDDETFSTEKAVGCTREELLALQLRVASEKDDAELNLRSAKTVAAREGKFADPKWFRDTEECLRRKKRQLQWITTRLSELRRSNGNGTFYRDFYEVALKELPPEVVQHLVQVAKSRQARG